MATAVLGTVEGPLRKNHLAFRMAMGYHFAMRNFANANVEIMTTMAMCCLVRGRGDCLAIL